MGISLAAVEAGWAAHGDALSPHQRLVLIERELIALLGVVHGLLGDVEDDAGEGSE